MSRGIVEHRLAVDVRRIARNGWTSGTVRRFVGDVVCSSVGYVLDLEGASLVLTWASSGVPYRLPVTLTSTAPHFGGVRWWACCPSCSRRCAILYAYGRGFACRVCLDLTYESTREDAFSRACRRVDKVRVRHGAPRGLARSWGKPHRMRWDTFGRLLERERLALGVVSESVRRLVDTPWNPPDPGVPALPRKGARP
jgi:hypothetical protein